MSKKQDKSDKKKYYSLMPLIGVKPNAWQKFRLALKKPGKLLWKTAKVTFTLALMMSGVSNVVREAVEEITGDNYIIDYKTPWGSVTLDNRDPKDPIEVIDQTINNVLEIEGFENVYDESYEWTVPQKKAMLEEMARVVSKTSGIRIKEVEYKKLSVSNGDSAVAGKFWAFNLGKVAFSRDVVGIDTDFLENATMAKLASVFMHEAAGHGLDFISTATNDQAEGLTNNLDFEYLATLFSEYGDSVYFTSPAEVVAHTVQMKFEIEAEAKFTDSKVIYEKYYEKLQDILGEAIVNDTLEGRQSINYQTTSIEDIIIKGIKDLFSEDDQTFSTENAKDTELYALLKYAFGDFLNISYEDFLLGNIEYYTEDLNSQMVHLDQTIEHYENGNYLAILPRLYDEDYRGLSEAEQQERANFYLTQEMVGILKMIYYCPGKYDNVTKDKAVDYIKSQSSLISEENYEGQEVGFFMKGAENSKRIFASLSEDKTTLFLF